MKAYRAVAATGLILAVIALGMQLPEVIAAVCGLACAVGCVGWWWSTRSIETKAEYWHNVRSGFRRGGVCRQCGAPAVEGEQFCSDEHADEHASTTAW